MDSILSARLARVPSHSASQAACSTLNLQSLTAWSLNCSAAVKVGLRWQSALKFNSCATYARVIAAMASPHSLPVALWLAPIDQLLPRTMYPDSEKYQSQTCEQNMRLACSLVQLQIIRPPLIFVADLTERLGELPMRQHA